MDDFDSIELTKKDVERLVADPSADVRAATAAKVAKTLDKKELSPKEKSIAEDVIRIMVHDAEVIVRKTLADNLKDNPYIPHDVAKILARDIEEVAVPVIKSSQVFTSDDLIEIIEMNSEPKTVAVASRITVAPEVARIIGEKGTEKALATLIANEGADILIPTFDRMIERFPKSEMVQMPLVRRVKLPVSVAEKLVNIVSDEIRQTLITRHDLPEDIVSDIIVRAREETTIRISASSDTDDLQKMISGMNKCNRLTPSIIIRAICMGDIKFFEYSMAELSGLPILNCRALIHDAGELGLKRLYEKSTLPEKYFPIFRAAVDIIAENGYYNDYGDTKNFSRRTIERILTKISEDNDDMEDDDIEYLLGRLSLLPISSSVYG